MYKYLDRKAAGKVLAQELKHYIHSEQVIVLALPRGGVPVAFEIAKYLSVPLDVFLVRKLGVPGHEELAMGAIASGGVVVFNDDVLNQFGLSKLELDDVIEKEKKELELRETIYRGVQPALPIKDKIAILVDDGLATGSTMRAAIKALRKHRPEQIIIAVPVAPIDSYKKFAELVDHFICPLQPTYFSAVGEWYESFNQTTHEEVKSLLDKAKSITPEEDED